MRVDVTRSFHTRCSYGKIKSIKLVHDKQVRFFSLPNAPLSPSLIRSCQAKPRGYAFIECVPSPTLQTSFRFKFLVSSRYEEERSVKEAFDRADGRKIDGRRVLVDVERGRTVKGWKPRSPPRALRCRIS